MGDLIPAWAWVLIEDYVDRSLEDHGTTNPTAQETLTEVARLWPDLTCTILVQEPWQGTVRFKRLLRLSGVEMRPFLESPEGFIQEPFAGTIRFKWLARLPASEMEPFLEDPTGWIAARFGGGKFKMNLHHGMHFVNTKNFKPEGPARWQALPELAEE